MAEYYKNITEMWLTTRANSDSSITITHYDNDGNMINVSVIPKTNTNSFDWDNVGFG